MTISNDSIYQALTKVLSDIAPLQGQLKDVGGKITMIHEYILATQKDIIFMKERMAVHEFRLDLIERRNEVLSATVV